MRFYLRLNLYSMKRESSRIYIAILIWIFMSGHIFALPSPQKTHSFPDPAATSGHPDTPPVIQNQNAREGNRVITISSDSGRVKVQQMSPNGGSGSKQPALETIVTMLADPAGYCEGQELYIPIHITGENIGSMALYISYDPFTMTPIGKGWANIAPDFAVLANWDPPFPGVIILIIENLSSNYSFNNEKVIDLAFTYIGGTATFHFRRDPPDTSPPPLCYVLDDLGSPVSPVTYNDCVISPDPNIVEDPIFTAGATELCQDAPDETYAATATNSITMNYSALPVAAGTMGITTGIMNWDAAFSGTVTITATALGCGGPKSSDRVVIVHATPVCSITGADEVCPGTTGNSYAAPTGMITYEWSISGEGTIVGAVDGENVSVSAGADCNDSFMLTLTVTDSDGCSATCSKTVNVKDLTPPDFTNCQTSINTITDPGLNYAKLSPAAPVYSDNCTATGSIVVSWVMTGATTGTAAGIIPAPYQFNEGTTHVTYTFTDGCLNDSECSFDVVVAAFTCPGAINQSTDANVCTATLDPGLPSPAPATLEPPIAYTWVMTGVTTGSGSGPIGSYTFNAGETTITWTATNAAGTRSCDQIITITDIQPPTFTAPAAQSFCVENISTATFWEPTTDITPDRPEYFLFTPPNTALDLNPATFDDNCSLLPCDVEIRWRISFFDGTFLPADPLSYNTGQPSAYASDFQLPGSATGDVVHTITYWIVDCSNNVSLPATINITVKPRPDIIKSP